MIEFATENFSVTFRSHGNKTSVTTWGTFRIRSPSLGSNGGFGGFNEIFTCEVFGMPRSGYGQLLRFGEERLLLGLAVGWATVWLVGWLAA